MFRIVMMIDHSMISTQPPCPLMVANRNTAFSLYCSGRGYFHELLPLRKVIYKRGMSTSIVKVLP